MKILGHTKRTYNRQGPAKALGHGPRYNPAMDSKPMSSRR